MKVTPTRLPGVVIIEPQVFADDRGFFLEIYNAARFAEDNLCEKFVQDNHSRSCYGTLRGLHYQIQRPQGKLCYVVRGEVFDVAVDLRKDSPTFGQSTALRLSDEHPRAVYIPPGCAHGFCVLSEVADLLYKCTDFYSPQHERTILWNDQHLAIEWPIDCPLLSPKDQRGGSFAEAPYYEGDWLEVERESSNDSAS